MHIDPSSTSEVGAKAKGVPKKTPSAKGPAAKPFSAHYEQQMKGAGSTTNSHGPMRGAKPRPAPSPLPDAVSDPASNFL